PADVSGLWPEHGDVLLAGRPDRRRRGDGDRPDDGFGRQEKNRGVALQHRAHHSHDEQGYRSRERAHVMSTGNQIKVKAQKDPAVLEREIDQQRAEISDIVHALENKLSPGELIDTALGYVKGGSGEFFSNLSNTVKANPVPTVLTSIGLIWLMAGQNRQPRPHVASTSGTSVKDKLAESKDRLADTFSGLKHQGADVRDRTSQMGHNVSASVTEASHRVRDGSR